MCRKGLKTIYRRMTTATLHNASVDHALVHALVADQFPQWAHLPVCPVPQSGWDNRTFMLGDDMVVRMPSAQAYAAQVAREQRWLPYLRTRLPLEIPVLLACGEPSHGYPWPWSIYRWIDGDAAANAPPANVEQFATDLATLLNALRAVAAADGPMSGQDNFYRGGALQVYDDQLREAVALLNDRIDADTALATWEAALTSSWQSQPVWVHGDIALGNLLMRDGRLAAVIDFGQVCVGDPACDLTMAWTYFREPHRSVFRAQLGLDDATWQRGRAWALWKAAIVAAGTTETNAVESQRCWHSLHEILGDA